MLNKDQLSNLSEAKRNIQDKQIILKTAVDIQALLRILVDKEIVTKEEISEYRKEVEASSKYKNALTYIDQTMKEIERYEKDPQSLLKEIFNRKMNQDSY